MAFAKIKNRTQHVIVLYAADGDSVQVNAQAAVKVDTKFLIDYDRLQIQILEAPKVQATVEAQLGETKATTITKKKSVETDSEKAAN